MMVNEDSTVALMRERLQALRPERVEIYDESGEHVGHEGARGGGGHYQLLIVSDDFLCKAAVARHRMVYQAVADLMHRNIHALAIKAYTVDEFDKAFHA
ncbi:MAG: BolA family transcriptional regulator [Burkholderiales bacterium]|nr:BolA family transcriptional regulator [Burkholderiales bacterium]